MYETDSIKRTGKTVHSNMAKQQENSQEPSIEEILDSIRQIISDDDEGKAAPAPAPAFDEPIELTERAPEKEMIEIDMRDPEPVPPAPAPEPPAPQPEIKREAAPAPQPPAQPVPQFAPPATVPEVIKAEPVPEPAPVPAPAVRKAEEPVAPVASEPPKPAETNKPGDDFNTVLTKNAEDSVMGAFTELTRRAAISRIDDVTVEDIVRDEIRPILKVWLDKNLPDLVEKLLQKELERISRRVIGDD